MSYKIKAQKGICKKALALAESAIISVETGVTVARKLNCNGARVIIVNRRYRAIKSATRAYWFVCSHEAYNKLTTSGHRY